MIIKWSILQFDFDSWTNIKNILTTWSFTISSLWWNFRIKRRRKEFTNFPLFFQHSIRLKLEQSVFRNYLISKWSIKVVERHSSSFGLSVMRSHPINFHGSRRRLCVKIKMKEILSDEPMIGGKTEKEKRKSLKWSNFNYSTTVWSFKHSKASCSQVSTLPTKPRVGLLVFHSHSHVFSSCSVFILGFSCGGVE